MPRPCSTVAGLLIALAAAAAVAQTPATQPAVTLKVGDVAPALTVGEWLKGEPVSKFEPGKRYVLEFWATWCGPCREAMPLLTALQVKYPQLTVIGVDVLEEDPDAAKPFVARTGGLMKYRVVADDVSKDADGAMNNGWLKAAGFDSIPTTFLVDTDGRIAWIGEPEQVERVLQNVAAGTFDRQAEAGKTLKMRSLEKQADTQVAAGDADAVVRTDDAMIALDPSMAERVHYFEVLNFAKDRPDLARSRAKLLAEEAQKPSMLAAVAVTLVGSPQASAADFALAHQALDRAALFNKDQAKTSSVLFASAFVAAREKNWAKAVELQRKAVDAAPDADKPRMKKVLDGFQNQKVLGVDE